ncbi:3-hydroxybutyryl-CoA dehydrogenase [Amycolatopsis sulphurea]|uniref:3-hydroxybutyryl-CoA dehydrogenase n=1 Tax=Amycolatopsis sulphurea TaxID=76022 RepID=A0A2A9FJJ3_9PSEU|nr:3-hydroxyacyl-CoA dehydrogenase family protein [Amycolatopsis sulphurea]PFG50732.1 3-hydroxybutyryl-CoA dehydrogenase [Amycolatopsis sulphurea]
MVDPVAAPSLPVHLRLLRGMLADAVSMLRSGFATAQDIDTAMRLGAGHPVGPLTVLRDLDAFDREALGLSEVPATEAPDVTATSAAKAWWGTVGVVGTGTMATGIAEAIAASGTPVRVLARSVPARERLHAAVAASLARAVKRGRRQADEADRIRARVHCVLDAAALADCAVVIEAVAEQLDVKREVCARLDAIVAPGTPIATNTSSFRVAELAAVAPERPILALHFFNPAPAMKLVEVVVPEGGSRALATVGAAWTTAIGKTAIHCGDQRGFLVNRLLIPYLNDAARRFDEGDVTPAELDEAMTTGAGHPMGPLALIDLIGADVTAAALSAMAEAYPDSRLVPAASLRRMIEAGHLGKKTGQGFYLYR